MIRQPAISDVEQLLDISTEFVQENTLFNGLDYDAGNALNTIMASLSSPQFINFVYEVDGVIHGVVSGSLDASWTAQPVVYEHLFYIREDYRNGFIAKALLNAFTAECEERGARKVYMSSTAGLDFSGKNAKLFTRLAELCGFSAIKNGHVLIKDM